jgi:hypothetical protein
MNVTLKDESGEEKKEVAESVTIAAEPIPAPQVIQELTNEVHHLRDEIVELKQKTIPESKPPEEPKKDNQEGHPQQVTPTTTEETSSPPKLSESNKSFLNTLFGVIGTLIMFISRALFAVFNLLFSFIKTILDMFLDILVAVDFTGILADLTDRKDKV